MEHEYSKPETPIHIRVKAEQKHIIEQACLVLGKNRSEFMLEASIRYAQDVLLDQSFFQLEQKKFEKFCDLLESPAAPPQKLIKLLNTGNQWDD